MGEKKWSLISLSDQFALLMKKLHGEITVPRFILKQWLTKQMYFFFFFSFFSLILLQTLQGLITRGLFSTCGNGTKQNTWESNKQVGSDNPLFTINIKSDKALSDGSQWMTTVQAYDGHIHTDSAKKINPSKARCAHLNKHFTIFICHRLLL